MAYVRAEGGARLAVVSPARNTGSTATAATVSNNLRGLLTQARSATIDAMASRVGTLADFCTGCVSCLGNCRTPASASLAAHRAVCHFGNRKSRPRPERQGIDGAAFLAVSEFNRRHNPTNPCKDPTVTTASLIVLACERLPITVTFLGAYQPSRAGGELQKSRLHQR